jgi:hypothetical protein
VFDTWLDHCIFKSKDTPSTLIVLEEVIWLAPTFTETLQRSSQRKRQISVLFSLTFSPESLSQVTIIFISIKNTFLREKAYMADIT